MSWSGWVAIRFTRPYDTTLVDGPRGTMALVDETAAQVAADRAVTPDADPPNADIARAERLCNTNHVSGHCVPGINGCDSWRNIIHGGWNAYDGVECPIYGPKDAGALLEQTRAARKRRDYAVTTQTFGDTFPRLTIDIGDATVQLIVDAQRGTASPRGTTNCLAP